MEEIQNLLLLALQAGLNQTTVKWQQPMETKKWAELFLLAAAHKVLPMVYEAVYACPAAKQADPRLFAAYKQQTMLSVMQQARKTGEFLELYEYLGKSGVTPLVVKGIVCRSLYPKPDHRPSGDEDLLIPEAQFARCHQAMLDYGMELVDPGIDLNSAYEVPYRKPDSPLYIELHKRLFPPESEAYGDLNRFFPENVRKTRTLTVDGKQLVTLDDTEHMLYLICHALKHFLHSGFGIRQVSDIALFANAYGKELDWQRLLDCCKEIHGEIFAAALFRIGEKYLTLSPEQAEIPEAWRSILADEQPLLEDLLDSGIYGDATMSRKHSSTMTLDAVAAEKHGKRAAGLRKTLFPAAKQLEGRYPYLKNKPYLLPIAWLQRIGQYESETRKQNDGSNRAADAVKIGAKRVELLRAYGILRK